MVLLVDEAHDLHHRTLTGLKRLMEVIRDGGGKLSILLAGHPKLKNDLKGPTMEEVGYRTIVVSLDAMQGNLREYVYWLLDNCTDDKTKPTDVIEEQAIDYLVERLTTPLQIEQHLSLALEEGFNVGVKPITVDVLDLTLSRRINDIEPRLIRHGYSEKVLVDQFHYKPAELRKFLKVSWMLIGSKKLRRTCGKLGCPFKGTLCLKRYSGSRLACCLYLFKWLRKCTAVPNSRPSTWRKQRVIHFCFRPVS